MSQYYTYYLLKRVAEADTKKDQILYHVGLFQNDVIEQVVLHI